MAGITRSRRPAPTNRTEAPLERRKRRASSSVLDALVNPGRMVAQNRKRAVYKKARRQTYAPPPVMARGGLQDMATPVRRHSRTRQRYDIALSIPGAEVRLPSVPALRVGWRVASGILAVMMALSLYVLLYTPAFQVEVLEVEGLQRLTLEDINAVLDISGEAIVKVDPEQLHEDLLAAFPELSSIQVKVYLPARVKLVVVERTPVIAWVQQNSTGNVEERWIDLEGIAFLPRGKAGDLIRVEAEGRLGADGLTQDTAPNALEKSKEGKQVGMPSPMISTELVTTLRAMRDYVPAGTPIFFSTEHGFGWRDPNGWQVYFGKSLAEMSQKLLVYQKLVDKLAELGIEPSMISVEYLHAPFYRTER